MIYKTKLPPYHYRKQNETYFKYKYNKRKHIMGCISEKMDKCITYHSKELYIENEEKRFQRAYVGYKDTIENKKKRRKKSEQDFLKNDNARRKWMEGQNISDSDIIQNYKNFTAEM
jgi:hypothetical protein